VTWIAAAGPTAAAAARFWLTRAPSVVDNALPKTGHHRSRETRMLKLCRNLLLAFAVTSAAGLGTACDPGETRVADQHKVYFVGYAYDGARGVRLPKSALTSVSIKYRDKVVAARIEEDGRFVTTAPLPTWQDYAVTIMANGFRPFVSRNPGIDVPASLAMTDGLATSGTDQTFHFDAHLFPTGLKAPKLALTIDYADQGTPAGAPAMPPARAAGTIRLRPETSSLLEQGAAVGAQAGQPARGTRRWANDEDLLNRTVTKTFTDGKVEIPEGELAYGVGYQVAIFDVRGYQPLLLSGQQGVVAGTLTSKTIALPKEMKEPLKIVSSTAATCTPPAGTATTPGAEIKLTFNDNVELVGTTFAEEIDNGVTVAPTGFAGGVTNRYCGLRDARDPAQQERGTKVTVEGSTLTLSFTPSVGLDTTTVACTVPPMLTSVTYGNLQAVQVRPAGETSLTARRSLGQLVAEHLAAMGSGSGAISTNAISCPARF
jgi:hypothetical protein